VELAYSQFRSWIFIVSKKMGQCRGETNSILFLYYAIVEKHNIQCVLFPLILQYYGCVEPIQM